MTTPIGGFSANGPLTPNPKLPNIINSFAPKTNAVSSALQNAQMPIFLDPNAKPTSLIGSQMPFKVGSPVSGQVPLSVTNPVGGFGGSQQQSAAGLHAGLVSGIAKTGGTHTTTDTAGNTSMVKIPAPTSGLTVNGVQTSGAPGTIGNQGPNAANNSNPNEPVAQYTTPSGAVVDANGNTVTMSPAQQNSLNQSSAVTAAGGNTSYPGLVGTASSLYGQLPGVGQEAANVTKEAQKKYEEIGTKGAQGQAGYLSGMGTNPVAAGNAGIVAQNVAAQQSAVTGGANLALSGLSQQQGAITGAAAGQAGLAGLTPEILRYGGANGGPMTAAEATAYKAKLDQVGSLTTQISTLQSTKDAADASMTRAVNAAGSLGGDTPIAQGLAQLTGNTIQDSAAVAAFQSQLATARQQWTNLGLGDAMKALPDNITKNQLLQAQQTMQKQVAANLKNLNDQVSSLQSGTSGGTTGGTTNTTSTGGANPWH